MHDWRAAVRERMAGARLDPETEAGIVEEIAQHLESQFADLAAKIGAANARAQLLAELKDRAFDEAVRGRARRSRPSRAGLWGRSSIGRDVSYALRSLRRTPGVVASGVAALALGIGLTTVMFSIIYGLLIKGLPFPHADRIAMIYRADPSGRGEEDLVPFGDFVRFQAEQQSFEAFGGFTRAAVNVSGGDRPERVDAARMAGAALDVPGVRPLLGRSFAATDLAPGAPPTAVLGYAFWRDRFARDSTVLTKAVHVDGVAYSVIGVMPGGFSFPESEALWLPMQSDPATTSPGRGTGLVVVGKLRKEAEYRRANAELRRLALRLERENADTGASRTLAQPFLRGQMPTRVYALLYSMLGGVFLVLLVACANVTNLLLDRAVKHTREIGIRLALGASRTAVVRQSLVESSILAAVAAVLGAALAQGGIVAFNRAMVEAGEVPFWMDVRLHLPVLLFVAGVAVLASLVSGVIPALHSARLDINTILKDESHSASSRRVGRASRTIVVAEIALSSVMLLAAGFMTKSIVQLRSFHPGFASAHVFTARVSPSAGDTLARRQFLESLEAALSSVSGTEAVSLGNDLPGTGWRGDQVATEGRTYARAEDRPITRWLAVSPGFFRTFDVRVLSGRAILPTDRGGARRVALVSEGFVRRQFAGVDPVGRRIRLGNPKSDWLTIVGVIPSLYAAGRTSANGDHFPPEVLTAFWQQQDWSTASIAIRGPSGVANASSMRKVVAALDPDTPLFAAATMGEVLNQPTWPARVFGTMFIIFGIVSLALAAIGLYAVMSFATSQRVREMGVRMALGASRGRVIRMVCGQGMRQLLVGMAIGLFMGAGLVRSMRALLFEVRAGDPSVFVLVAGVLAAAAFVACIIPAVRATRVDPLIALRGG